MREKKHNLTALLITAVFIVGCFAAIPMVLLNNRVEAAVVNMAFQQPTVSLPCPAGTTPITALSTRNTTNNSTLNWACVDASGQLFLSETTQPRMFYGVYEAATVNGTQTLLRVVPDRAITITRITSYVTGAGVQPLGCTTAVNFYAFDGANSSTAAVTANATSFGDSGAISFNVAAGAQLDVRQNAAGCATQGTLINVAYQYKMQS